MSRLSPWLCVKLCGAKGMDLEALDPYLVEREGRKRVRSGGPLLRAWPRP